MDSQTRDAAAHTHPVKNKECVEPLLEVSASADSRIYSCSLPLPASREKKGKRLTSNHSVPLFYPPQILKSALYELREPKGKIGVLHD